MPAVPCQVFRRPTAPNPAAREQPRGAKRLPLAAPAPPRQPGLFDRCRPPDRFDFDRAAHPGRPATGRRRAERGRKAGDENFARNESAAATMRGILVARLDRAYAAGEASPLGRVLALADAALRAVDSSADELFQALQAALFPEEFLPPGELAGRGLIPPGGGQQAGAARLAALAALG